METGGWSESESRRIRTYDSGAGGKKCYCGKAGCADAYCAASALTDEEQEMTLEQFYGKSGAEKYKDCGKMESVSG